MSAVYLSTAYLAPVQYYVKLATHDTAYIEAEENYLKQTYRNRCHIAGANGALALTVPVEKSAAVKCPVRDVRISEHGGWRRVHWQALVSAYGLSPFFEYYQDDFAPFYAQRYKFLFDFNEALRQLVCNLIGIAPDVRFTTRYVTDVPNDYREVIRPRNAPRDIAFDPQPYGQVFREKYGFLPNLSIVDLLFNLGPETILTLRRSVAQ